MPQKPLRNDRCRTCNQQMAICETRNGTRFLVCDNPQCSRKKKMKQVTTPNEKVTTHAETVPVVATDNPAAKRFGLAGLGF